jgi:hypothetical protein
MIHRFTRTALTLAACTLLGSSIASAQATRTWVSGVGDDVNPCSRTAPCKTFAGAISKTAAGGEIDVLDSGGFGGVTITKSITIHGVGEDAGVLVSGTNAIIINGANIAVQLRHLQINGLGLSTGSPGLVGIKMINAKSLVVDNVFVHGFQTAIEVTTGMATVTNSLITNNLAFGVNALGGTLTVENSTLSHNNVAVQATGAGTVRLSNNGVYNNLTGFGCGGGTLASAGNNRKAGNVGGVVATCTPTVAITLQ